MQEILQLKEKPSNEEFISLTQNCCDIHYFQVPRQEGDPRCSNVHVIVGDVFVGEALCDLGAGGNLMSLSTFNRIGGLTLRPCFINVGLADGSETKHVGMVRNMMIDINVFQFKIDFIIVQDKGEQECPLILRRSSMATAKALVDLEASVHKNG